VVHPGGTAQVCHRDYHLGFQRVDQLGAYPQNVHKLSPHLTLQGAIAHSSMPIASGPTQLLPHSQKFAQGYVATQLEEFRQYFAEHHVQLPLDTGDMVFFNPAVLHAAGDNHTDNDRFANLLQIGSAFGRTLEMIDRTKLCRLLYPVLLQWQDSGTHTQQQIDDERCNAACEQRQAALSFLKISDAILYSWAFFYRLFYRAFIVLHSLLGIFCRHSSVNRSPGNCWPGPRESI